MLLVFASFATAHALTFLEGRYTCVKLPLLVMGLALTLAAAGDRTLDVGAIRLRLASALGGAALAASAAATLALLGR